MGLESKVGIMYIVNKEVLKKLPCYVTDEKLAIYLTKNKLLSVLSVVGKNYYFMKNSHSDKIFKGEIPLFYRWFSVILETKGGEEN